MAEIHKMAQAMCSIDLTESFWTQELPCLPVPDLWLTVDRYLSSLRAVLAPPGPPTQLTEPGALGCPTKEQREELRKQFEHTEQIVRNFMLDEGPQLQRDLKEYASKCQNWATEFWLKDMYLSNPLPLPVNSNPFFLFPRQQFDTSQEMLMFATRIIQFAVDFKYRIDQQTLRQDFGSGHGKGKPLCMATYKYFFHSYRMPHEGADRLLPQSRRSNHIVVASCNQFYVLRLGQDPLENPYRKEASALMNETSIYEQLLRIYRVSRESAKRNIGSSSKRAIHPKVGLFTTENRLVWAKLHKKLSHCGENGQATGNGNSNNHSLRQIEDCLFVMCLDSLVGQSQSSPRSAFSSTESNSKEETGKDVHWSEQPANYGKNHHISDVEAAEIILTGGGSHLFTANRWFDKFLQIIVGRNGICGINIEHSASEGITVLRFLVDFLDFIRQNPIKESSRKGEKEVLDNTKPDQHNSRSITSSNYEEPKSPRELLEETDKITPLNWTLDEFLLEAIDEAEVKVNKLIENFSLYILNFEHFGRSFIKNQNLSPDAFVQLALQYTFYKLHGHLVSTYESASLRQFRLGRVDNIRANTCEAFEWIQTMLACRQNDSKSRTGQGLSKWRQAESSFIKAITKQVEILRYTITGGGPDNHLLAIKELARLRYDDDELPEIITDPSYKEFLNFRLSTSQLPNESGITVGYGAVTPDGYGCSYNPCSDGIVFCISSFEDCPITSSSKFARNLEESLLEMQDLCKSRGK